jgi:hypothetical protein
MRPDAGERVLGSGSQVANPARVLSVEYAYREVTPGQHTATQVGFDYRGVDVRITEDFAAGFVDVRGIYKKCGRTVAPD